MQHSLIGSTCSWFVNLRFIDCIRFSQCKRAWISITEKWNNRHTEQSHAKLCECGHHEYDPRNVCIIKQMERTEIHFWYFIPFVWQQQLLVGSSIRLFNSAIRYHLIEWNGLSFVTFTFSSIFYYTPFVQNKVFNLVFGGRLAFSLCVSVCVLALAIWYSGKEWHATFV